MPRTGRRRTRLIAGATLLVWAIAATGFGAWSVVAWRSSDRGKHDARREAARLTRRNTALEQAVTTARSDYRGLESQLAERVSAGVKARVAIERERAFQGGVDSAFGFYDDGPWHVGSWYLVRIGQSEDHLWLAQRAKVTPGTRYVVESNNVYYAAPEATIAPASPPAATVIPPAQVPMPPAEVPAGIPSSSAPGGYNAAGCPKNQWVNGYVRADGTVVSGYWRNSPTDSCDSSP